MKKTTNEIRYILWSVELVVIEWRSHYGFAISKHEFMKVDKGLWEILF